MASPRRSRGPHCSWLVSSPHIQGFLDHLLDTTTCIFSKIDLVWSYRQIPMTPADVPKTATIIPFWNIPVPRNTFELKNAAQSLQLLINGLPWFRSVFVVVEGILVACEWVYSKAQTSSESVAYVAKCQFGHITIDFLVNFITQNGTMHFPNKVKSISDFK